MKTDVINIDQVELRRLCGVAEIARRAVKEQRVKMAILECYGSWEGFVEAMADKANSQNKL